MTSINIYNVCEDHRLGLGCSEHCHIMNDCDPCYAVMENTAQTMLRKARESRHQNLCIACQTMSPHCPDCHACNYEPDNCQNLFCESELIDCEE